MIHDKTIDLGTRIFLGDGVEYVTWHGTQHNPKASKSENGTTRRPASLLMIQGDLKVTYGLKGISMLGIGQHPCCWHRNSHSNI